MSARGLDLDRDRIRFAAECAGKERHVSKAAAEAVAALGRATMEAYRCSYCELWHLASVPGHRSKTPDNGRGVAFEKLRHKRRPRARRSRHRWGER